jgi:hypothetical protein
MFLNRLGVGLAVAVMAASAAACGGSTNAAAKDGGTGGDAAAGAAGGDGMAGSGGASGGAGGTAGASDGGGGETGDGGTAPSHALGVFLARDPSAPSEAIITVLDLETGARGPIAAFPPPAATNWTAVDAKVLPDGQVRLLWANVDPARTSAMPNARLDRLDPSLHLINSVSYSYSTASVNGVSPVAYLRRADGTAQTLWTSAEIVQLDASDQIDPSAPVVSSGATGVIYGWTAAADGTTRVFQSGGATGSPLVLKLTAANQKTATTLNPGNMVATPFMYWTPLSYQVERDGRVHILWTYPDPTRPSTLLQTVLCTYPDEASLATFPVTSPDGGLPPCEQEPTSVYAYSSTP